MLAVFGLPALTVALGLIVLWGLKPWEHDSGPHDVPLGIETAVGDGRALPVAPATRVAAGVAVATGPKLVVSAAQKASSDASPVPAPAPTGVAPAQAIAVAEVPSSPAGPAPGAGTGEEAPSAGATTGEAPSEGASSPVATPAGTGEGSPGGPITAGVGPVPQSCEGDEYLITITFLDEESTVEEARVAIVLERLNEDGTTDELQLEGDLSDARSLAAMLSSEGNCVRLEVVAPEEEGVPSDGTSQAVVPSEGTPTSSAAPAASAAPASP